MKRGSDNRSVTVAVQKQLCNRNARSGITLMELLVAVTLLSLLSVGILFAFRTGLTAMGRTKDRLLSNRRVLGVERILEHQIAGFIPTKADCRPGPGASAQRLPFFQGDPQTMRFVSTYSLQEASRGYPRILEFQVIPGENGEGVRLIVNEQLYSGPESTGMHCLGLRANPETQSHSVIFRPVQIGSASYVLADKLAECRFAYREEREPPQQAIWRTQWPKDTTPAAVRIDMIPLVVDPAKLQVPAIVAPFRADRHTMENFTDVQ